VPQGRVQGNDSLHGSWRGAVPQTAQAVRGDSAWTGDHGPARRWLGPPRQATHQVALHERPRLKPSFGDKPDEQSRLAWGNEESRSAQHGHESRKLRRLGPRHESAQHGWRTREQRPSWLGPDTRPRSPGARRAGALDTCSQTRGDQRDAWPDGLAA
jgi:hypothetical protein